MKTPFRNHDHAMCSGSNAFFFYHRKIKNATINGRYALDPVLVMGFHARL